MKDKLICEKQKAILHLQNKLESHKKSLFYPEIKRAIDVQIEIIQTSSISVDKMKALPEEARVVAKKATQWLNGEIKTEEL